MPASGSKSAHSDPHHIAACKLYIEQRFPPLVCTYLQTLMSSAPGGTVPLPRSTIGTVLMGGALSATLAALVTRARSGCRTCPAIRTG